MEGSLACIKGILFLLRKGGNESAFTIWAIRTLGLRKISTTLRVISVKDLGRKDSAAKSFSYPIFFSF